MSMSVNEKMTAIADKIRALLGISDTMGLDAMANNLAAEQTNVRAAFTAIGNKGGTVPPSKVSGNLASAIVTIPTGSGGSSNPVLQAKSVTPSETAQTVTPDSGYDGLSSVSVGAISSTYVGSGVTRKTAATIMPGTTDQTIAAGQYLSGAQTIKGDANLKAENIKSGVSIFGITGTANTAAVQRKTGTVTTDINGLAEINCGFMPDIVVFTDFFYQNYGYECQAAIAFSEKKNDYHLFASAVSDAFLVGINFEAWQTSNGFGVWTFTMSESGVYPVNNLTFPYVAIKYT